MTAVPRTAIVTLTHYWTRGIQREHRKRVKQAGRYGDVWLLYHQYKNRQVPAGLRVECMHRSDLDRLNCPPPPIALAEGGHSQLFMLEFARRHPEYDHYWFIEFDVRFCGDWGVLFETMQNVDSDFFAPCMRRYDQQPVWKWWSTLTHPNERVPESERVRCLNVICRLSRPACHYLESALMSGWNGHSEVIFPTLLARAGFRISDFGGRGPFTPPALCGRFYIEGEDLPDGLRHTGTMRVNPPRLFCGFSKNRIYHPVKPLSGWAVRRARWLREAVRRRLGF